MLKSWRFGRWLYFIKIRMRRLIKAKKRNLKNTWAYILCALCRGETIMLLQLSDDQKNSIHAMAKQLCGLPYKMGAKVSYTMDITKLIQDKFYIDCSGLTSFIMGKLGYIIPDGSYCQFDASLPITTTEIGDLVFKKDHISGNIDHVGMVMSVNPVIIVQADGWAAKMMVDLQDFDSFSHPRPLAAQYAGVRRLLLDKIEKIA